MKNVNTLTVAVRFTIYSKSEFTPQEKDYTIVCKYTTYSLIPAIIIIGICILPVIIVLLKEYQISHSFNPSYEDGIVQIEEELQCFSPPPFNNLSILEDTRAKLLNELQLLEDQLITTITVEQDNSTSAIIIKEHNITKLI